MGSTGRQQHRSGLPDRKCQMAVGSLGPQHTSHNQQHTSTNTQPQAHNYKHTMTHSEIGFQLTQFPGEMAMEPKGARVGATELFKKLFTHLQNTAERRRLKAAVGNLFEGKVS